MKIFIHIISLVICMAVCSSCSMFGFGAAKTEPSTVVSDAAKSEPWREKSIDLNIKADAQLNLYQNSSHVLYLCTCQLKEPNAFNQLIDEKGGIERLISECNRFDGSVAYTKRYVVQPDQLINDKQDHAEGARYLGIVAGYFSMNKGNVTRLIPISKSLSMSIELGTLGIQSIREK